MTLRIGHRGARGLAPENTLAGIECAIAHHAHLVEFDVQRTQDGQLVVLHDATLDRTTTGHGAVAQKPWAELQPLTAGDGERIPLLRDVLRTASGRTGVMIELKAEGLAEDVYDAVQASAFVGPVIYASFFHEELLTIHRLDRHAQTLALIEAVPINRTAFATDAHATHVGLAYETLTPSFLAALHAQSLRVFVYTVNDPVDIRAAKSLGVDGIISDYPDRLR
ncbi:MAG: glycerophosphodiester phosphodiesterase family protein [Nitrospiraceae bacterium]